MSVFLEEFGVKPAEVGIIVVDHGSRRAASNDVLLEVVHRFQHESQLDIVEPAHMELAEPSIHTAFGRCVQQGARLVVVHPFFLLPGRHWDDDIPSLSAAACRQHPGVRYLVTAPVGMHPLMTRIMGEQIQQCLAHTLAGAAACRACSETDKCQVRQSDDESE